MPDERKRASTQGVSHRLARFSTSAALMALALVAVAPVAAEAAPATWLVGTETGAHAARTMPGSAIAPGIRAVRGGGSEGRRLRRLPGVRWVEPNRRFRASGSVTQADPLRGRQWALGSARVPGAWAITVGGDVTVAVLDSGIDLSNPELAGNLWTNTAEVDDNGLDDDRNGFVDDVHGGDIVNGDGDPADDFGHGTTVAGVIGARGDNGIGISGVAWRVRLMPLKILGNDGWGTTASLVTGLRYAVAKGARVINMSVNGADASRALDEAIREAEAQGALVVTSAGNDGADRDRVASYPASVASPALLAVASANRAGRLAHSSAYGERTVDIAAPGEDILTSDLGGRYSFRSGTSYAAAYVSGAAALLAAARPKASGAELREALVASARRGGGVDASIAGAQLDVTGALKRLAPRLYGRSAKRSHAVTRSR
jgi:subtilisin family serine protease